jgi:hypothetical protein
MAKTEHSKIPWRARLNEDGFRIMTMGGCFVCEDVDLFEVRGQDSKTEPTGKQRANAEFIVRACNSFYPMLEALRECRAELDAVPMNTDAKSLALVGAYYKADKAIKQAEGE